MATEFEPDFAADEATFSDEGPGVTIRVGAPDNGHTVTVSGELEFSNAHRLFETVANIHLDGHRSVVLNLTGLTYCDAAAVSALIRAHKYVRGAGGRLSITGVSGIPQRVLTLTGVDKFLDVQ